MASGMKMCALALACVFLLFQGGSDGHNAGERSLLQAGANTLNNDPRNLAPAPGPGMPPLQPIVNVTTRSFVVLTAASGFLTRTMYPGHNITNGALLTLNGVDQHVTWYSEAPIRQSGSMEVSTFANTSFFHSASSNSTSGSWLNAGNMALSYTDTNTSTRGTTVLAVSLAPEVLNGGSTWRMNVTINSDSDSYTRVVTALNNKAQTAREPSTRQVASVSAFFSGVCYSYNRNTGEILNWHFCTHISRNGEAQYS